MLNVQSLISLLLDLEKRIPIFPFSFITVFPLRSLYFGDNKIMQKNSYNPLEFSVHCYVYKYMQNTLEVEENELLRVGFP